MNRLILVLVLIVACVIGLGFYQKWFQVSSDSTDGKGHLELTVDKDKIREDETKALHKVQGQEHQTQDKGKDPIATPVQPPQ